MFVLCVVVMLSFVILIGIVILGGSVVYVMGLNMLNDNILYCFFGTIFVSA